MGFVVATMVQLISVTFTTHHFSFEFESLAFYCDVELHGKISDYYKYDRDIYDSKEFYSHCSQAHVQSKMGLDHYILLPLYASMLINRSLKSSPLQSVSADRINC